MRPLTQALPGALAELLRDVPISDGKVAFAWKAAVGARVERVTSVKLDGRVLFVEVPDLIWAREINRSSPVILARVRTLLGQEAVSRIEVRKHPNYNARSSNKT
jgi:predicted nucleic acid-binding Zn ribbon protein